MGIIKSVSADVSKIELITTSQWYTFPISLTFSDDMMNESLYVNEELKSLIAVILLTLLTCVLSVDHMMSNVLVITPTIVELHCNINGWLIVGLLTVVISTTSIGPTNHMCNKFMKMKIYRKKFH